MHLKLKSLSSHNLFLNLKRCTWPLPIMILHYEFFPYWPCLRKQNDLKSSKWRSCKNTCKTAAAALIANTTLSAIGHSSFGLSRKLSGTFLAGSQRWPPTAVFLKESLSSSSVGERSKKKRMQFKYLPARRIYTYRVAASWLCLRGPPVRTERQREQKCIRLRSRKNKQNANKSAHILCDK